jgi:hypothetical protein
MTKRIVAWCGAIGTVAVVLGFVVVGTTWVRAADRSHQEQRSLEEIIRQNNDWIQKEEAVREREKEIQKCIRQAKDKAEAERCAR